MKKLKGLCTALFMGMLFRPSLLMAQDGNMFIDDLEAADSSHMEMEFMADAVSGNSGSISIPVIIIVVLAILGIAGFLLMRKKKSTT